MPRIQRDRRRCYEYTLPYLKLWKKVSLKGLTRHNPTTTCMLLYFFCGFWLFTSNIPDCYQHGGIKSHWVVQNITNNTLYMAYFGGRQHRRIVVFGRILYVGTVCRFGPIVGGILMSDWNSVLKTMKHGRNVSWHRNVNIFFYLIPLYIHSAKKTSGPIFGHSVQLLKGN